ncbi:MAG: RNA 2',3'-cyclic phosphodiesterase [Desulfurococcales archaeon]|nr:RNA 2',3'-cyclic phosphodiesterase [Desulfurococcales archaeon]
MYGERLRIFIAVDVEDPLLVSRIERIKEAIIATGVPMKPVETQNLHLTLRFIGEVPRATVEEVVRLLQEIKFQPFKIVFKGLGAFPSPTRPRVVWIGVDAGGEELARIREQIDEGLRRIGLPPERQKFHPHLTLARIKGSRNIHSLIKLIQEMSDIEVWEMTVSSVRLKKSTLTRHGPIYETLAEVRAA